MKKSIAIVLVALVAGMLSGCPDFFVIPTTYSVLYNGNGSTGGIAPIDSTAHASGAIVVVLGVGSLVKTGCTFAGWNTATDGSGTALAAGSSFLMPANNLTLYATWTPDAVTGDYNYTSASPVYAVDFGAASSRDVTITGLTNKSVYLVKANTSSSPVTASLTGLAASAGAMNPDSRDLFPAFHRALDTRPERLEHAGSAEFNANPPPVIRDQASSKVPAIPYGDSSAVTVNTTTRSFWVETYDRSGVWNSIPATLRSVGRYCYIWVANVNYDNTSVPDNDNLVTTAQANALRDRFDGTSVNSYNDGIFKNMTTVFGYEFGGGAGGTGGRDNDQHIAILVYDIDHDQTPSQSSGVFGFFWSKDYYSQAALGATPKTNLSEIFYIDAHFTDRYPHDIESTLAHEFQHMIHFNQKNVIHSANSLSWFNEMCSLEAEDLVNANIFSGLPNPSQYGPLDRLNTFAWHYPESGVTDWLSSPNALKSYASAYAFGAYLARNYGGAPLFGAMVDNTSANEASVTAALSTLGYSDTFLDAFKKYGEALVFTDIPSGSSVKTLKRSQSNLVSGITYTLVPIDFATIQQYNRDTSSWGDYGPRVFTPGTQVTLRPYGNSIHTADPGWKNLTGSLVVSLTAPIDANVKYYLMVK